MDVNSDFNKTGHSLINWLTEYFEHIEEYPVLSTLKPGDVEKKLPDGAPQSSETYEKIFNDFENILLPGITHWQHPGFHAYFPANNSEPSVLAEILMAGLGVQGMKWITSPAATELEKVVMKWLRQMIGLADEFNGVIMDTASVSTLCAILAAREKITGYQVNEKGFGNKILRIYCSSEAHSSIEKAVRIAGIGTDNLVKIPIDNQHRMLVTELNKQIEYDQKTGKIPTCVIGALGTTGTGAIDPLDEISDVCSKNNIWFHIDAAFAGTALILPEFRSYAGGYAKADSLVFNPHKWMFTNFDCSAFFVRDSKTLTKTFSLVPPYLQTDQDIVLDFSNWGIQLGRRFRSLKLWYVIRHYGVSGIQQKLRKHIELAQLFEEYVQNNPDFEMLVPRNLNIICFRYNTGKKSTLNEKNKMLLDKINMSGSIFLSHTQIDGKFAIRFVCGQTNVEEQHISKAWKIISKCAQEL